jgi:hypothetical protein
MIAAAAMAVRLRRSKRSLAQTVLIEILRKRLDELLPEPLDRVLERDRRQQRRIAALLRKRR